MPFSSANRLATVALLIVCCIGCGSSDVDRAKPNTGAGKTPGGNKRIVFLTNGDDPYWDTCRAGFNEAAEKHGLAAAGIAVDFQKGNGKLEGQIERLRQYASESDVAGVAISVINAENKGIAVELEQLRDNGVHVITVDSDINVTKYPKARSYYLGTDNLVGGKTLGAAAKALLESKQIKSGAYVQFAGFRDQDNARARMNGFQEALGDAFKELDRMPDEMKDDVAHANVRSALDKFGQDDLVALTGIFAYNTPAIVDVLSERSVRDKYSVFCFDAAQDSIKAMSEGNVDVMVVQNPFEMGARSVELLNAMIQSDEATIKKMYPKEANEPGHDVFTTGLRVVVPNDASPIKAELFKEGTVELMSLPAFKDWLAKYKLKSS
jgi:ribose transport system substrate-binding protein